MSRVLILLFGEQPRKNKEPERIKNPPFIVATDTPQSIWNERYLNQLSSMERYLLSLLKDLDEDGPFPGREVAPAALASVYRKNWTIRGPPAPPGG